MPQSNPLIASHAPAFPWRGIHLDLKGVAPTPQRLIALLDVIAFAGYNMILVEWEDMFPWQIDERFRSPEAYDQKTLDRFYQRSAELGLTIVPLVQTLGHMETFLRVPGYEHLREVPGRSDVLNPLVGGANGAGELVAALVDELLDRTPNLPYLHLGGDEAWSFGSHRDTRAFIDAHGKAALYLKHIEPILDRLAARNIRPMLWHDMMIQWDDAALQRLAGKADIVAWGYHDIPDETTSHYQTRHIERFYDNGVPLWGAGAYKGPGWISGDLPDVDLRCTNALGWVDVGKRMNFKGLIATAWSRSSTHQPQKEPIDGALDAMLLIAAIFYRGEKPEDAQAKIAKALEMCCQAERFKTCHAVLDKLAQTRRDAWSRIRRQYEQQALAARSPRGDAPELAARTIPDLQQDMKTLDAMENEMLQAFAGLLAPTAIQEYVRTRVQAIHAAATGLSGSLGHT